MKPERKETRIRPVYCSNHREWSSLPDVSWLPFMGSRANRRHEPQPEEEHEPPRSLIALRGYPARYPGRQGSEVPVPSKQNRNPARGELRVSVPLPLAPFWPWRSWRYGGQHLRVKASCAEEVNPNGTHMESIQSEEDQPGFAVLKRWPGVSKVRETTIDSFGHVRPPNWDREWRGHKTAVTYQMREGKSMASWRFKTSSLGRQLSSARNFWPRRRVFP